MRFEFGKPILADESRELEFKAVSSANPVRAIADTCERYVVAFLNSRGGTILWGVRDGDKVVEGVKLTAKQRDEVRQAVVAKINSIEPKIDPTRFVLELHSVKNAPVGAELFVASLKVPRVATVEPFYGSGRDAFVRLDGVVRHLTGPELTAWITDRTRRTRKRAEPNERNSVEVYHLGMKLPFEEEVLWDFRCWSANRPCMAFDFHLPAIAAERRKVRFGIVTSAFFTVVADWWSGRHVPIMLPDGRHLFTSEKMVLNLLPGGWHQYSLTGEFLEHVVNRREEMAFRFFTDNGPADIAFAVRMLGVDPTPASRGRGC